MESWGGGAYGHAEIQYTTDGIIPPFEEIFSLGHLFKSWKEFKTGKRQKVDVTEFSTYLIERLQHALYRALYPYFDRKFIYDLYSCRLGKGTLRALKRFDVFVRRESHNHARTVWVLSCDIRKCFASVDHQILKNTLARHITCRKTLGVLNSVIDSFHTHQVGKGIPLGNLTSQLFINIYLNELDQCVKWVFKVCSYIRYADDFVIMSPDRDRLLELLPKIGDFLEEHLLLQLRPNDWPIRTIFSGVDFLGWVNFPNHRVLRNTTKWRMFRRLERSASRATLASYHGLLSHGNARKLQVAVDKMADLD